jgi:hypothetical protein
VSVVQYLFDLEMVPYLGGLLDVLLPLLENKRLVDLAQDKRK